MNSLKFLGLLLVAGIAGAGFAAVTTNAIPYFAPPRSAAIEAPPAVEPPQQQQMVQGQSWLEEGIGALDSPAWPFGAESSGDDDDAGLADPPQPYPDHASRYEDYGQRRYDPYHSEDEAPYYAPRPRDYPPAAAIPAPAPDPKDSAADAASRAAQTARDVSNAERGL